ncbi:MAG: putative DNA binding domain-containing protein [Magnetococcales bacterium]|nr:putative DNA binding domain-containing protein [Magnetococcales bacterium]
MKTGRTAPQANETLASLVNSLISNQRETSWVEFKVNNANPKEIGEYLSALSNAAALSEKPYGYLVWGVDDATHEVIGTTFIPEEARNGNEELRVWLARMLNPRLVFTFHRFQMGGKEVVLLEVPSAKNQPTQFAGDEFIRIGSSKKPLKGYPEYERDLWRLFDRKPFETGIALENLAESDVLSLLDFPAFFEMLQQPLPSDTQRILHRLNAENMTIANAAGGLDVTNLGAILFAKKLKDFGRLARKALRVVVYEGSGRIQTVREQEGQKVYASGFEGLLEFVRTLLPRNEVIGKALRQDVPMYPDLAIRELVANALIHQDFSVTGSGPMVEIFSDRMEITNPGYPLVSTDRFLDSPPRSRNEALAAFMRRIGVCEERGSGVDKVVSEMERYQLPAPRFETPEGSPRATLFAHKPFSDMDSRERVHACYLHACLRYTQNNPMTNGSLRERFGIAAHNSATASRIIRDAIEAEKIKPLNPEQAKKNSRYLPWWA